MKRSFKYRFYPTHAQAVELSRTFGCVRKVYNLALAARTDAWRRRDVLHRLTTRLARENPTLVTEDPAVSHMLCHRGPARAISDAGWRELRSMLEYKAARYGRELVVVDRWFPGSKLCSVCGELAGAMLLSLREWTCEGCGSVHDRDGNAALNPPTAGPAVVACGADVRPHRESSSRAGRSVAKQEFPHVSVGIPSR
ncbi:transposase [Streptomyces manipurensis]|uniref:transposase n=1 Tax=Streptomyces manipurensis TaxID=1077945 RepID=UPI003C6F6768